jgi:hypothetical protein
MGCQPPRGAGGGRGRCSAGAAPHLMAPEVVDRGGGEIKQCGGVAHRANFGSSRSPGNKGPGAPCPSVCPAGAGTGRGVFRSVATMVSGSGGPARRDAHAARRASHPSLIGPRPPLPRPHACRRRRSRRRRRPRPLRPQTPPRGRRRSAPGGRHAALHDVRRLVKPF